MAARGKLVDRLASKREQPSNNVAFLALREEIAEALEAGYTMKEVWEDLVAEGQLSMAYSTFRGRCRREFTEQAARRRPSVAEATKPAAPQPAASATPPRQASKPAPSAGTRRFRHNPSSKNAYDVDDDD